MSSLKEKLCEPFDGLKLETANKLEQIADDYAIEFAEWISKNYTKFGSIGSYYSYIDNEWYEAKQLLEIFKKEKGL